MNINQAFEALLAKAEKAGHAAADAVDLSKTTDGNGFVCVKLGKGSEKSDFARWLLKHTGEKEDGYYGVVYCPRPNNNPYGGVVKREEFARAFTDVVNAAGFYAFGPVTRLD